MPAIQPDLQIFSTQAGVATDWGAAHAQTQMNVSAVASFKRGIKAGVGATITAEAAASLSQFIAADIRGVAFASASAEVQAQMPFNLFDEMGLVVSAKAVAEASAGIAGNIGLSIGDFIDLAKSELKLDGLPLQLLLILLSEAEIKAGGFAKASAAAAAHAEIRISGNVVKNPGFRFYASAGAGLAVGAGFGVNAVFGLKNPTRMIGRMIDTSVDHTLHSIKKAVPNDNFFHRSLDASSIPLKIVLRSAFELGITLASDNLIGDAAGAKRVAQAFTKVVLEEIQRNFFELLIDSSLGKLNTILSRVAGSGSSTVTECLELLEDIQKDLTDHHLTITEITGKWQEFLVLSYNAVIEISSNNPSHDMLKSLSVLWASSQLLIAASEQVFETSVSASVMNGLRGSEGRSSYTGPITTAAPQLICVFINTAQGKSVDRAITKDIAVDFLANQLVLNEFFEEQPAFGIFLDNFLNLAGSSRFEITSTFIRNIGALKSVDGSPDTLQTAALLTEGLQKIINRLILDEISGKIDQSVHGEAKTYFKEILLPSVKFCNNITFETVANWQIVSAQQEGFKKIFQEAASSVLLLMLSRSLVSSLDILMDTALKGMSGICRNAAGNLKNNKLIDELERVSGGTVSAETVKTALEISADIFKPLPIAVREKFREAFFEVLAPMPDNPRWDYLVTLADPAIFPKKEALQDLWDCFVDYYGRKIIEFLLELLDRLGQLLLTLVTEFIEAVGTEIKKWLENVKQVKNKIAGEIDNLLEEIDQLIADAGQLFTDTLSYINSFIDGILGSNRATFITRLVDHQFNTIIDKFPANIEVRLANPAINLDLGPVHIEAPEIHFKVVNIPVRSELRKAGNPLRQLLSGIVRGIFENEIVDAVFDRLGAVKDGVEAIAEDIVQEDLSRDAAGKIATIIATHFKNKLPAGGYKVRIGINVLTHPVGIEYTVDSSAITTIIEGVARGFVGGKTTAINEIKGNQNKHKKAVAELQEKTLTKGYKEQLSGNYNRMLVDNRLVNPSVSILSPKPNEVLSKQPVLHIRFTNIPQSFMGENVVEKNADLVQGIVSNAMLHLTTASAIVGGLDSSMTPGIYYKPVTNGVLKEQQRMFILLNGDYEIDIKDYFNKTGVPVVTPAIFTEFGIGNITGIPVASVPRPMNEKSNGSDIHQPYLNGNGSIPSLPTRISSIKIGDFYPAILHHKPSVLPEKLAASIGTSLGSQQEYSVTIPVEVKKLRTGLNIATIIINNGAQTLQNAVSFFYIPSPVNPQKAPIPIKITKGNPNKKSKNIEVSTELGTSALKQIALRQEVLSPNEFGINNKRLINKYTTAKKH